MLNPSETIHRWLCGPSVEPPPHVRAAYQQIDRAEQIDGGHWIEHAMDDIDRVIAAAAQMELKLPERSVRARARKQVADYLRRVVMPLDVDTSIAKLCERLETARASYDIGVRGDGKMMLRWDAKAGLPLLCPDDAREEAKRLSRQYVPAIMDAMKAGCSAHYVCLTMPNPAPGELRKGITALFRRFGSLMRACKRKRSRPFPIVGALVVLEAPLGRYRNWHPHLNVILLCDGFLDYKKLREHWHWNAEMRKLEGSQAKLEATMRELIKYSCRAVPEKSQAKAFQAPPHSDQHGGLDGHWREPETLSLAPPAMIEWTAAEWIEWWQAHKRVRRTRSYGLLYGLEKPEKVDQTGILWIGRGQWRNGAYVERFPLLESIPGDKSTTADARERLKAHVRRLLGDPDNAKNALQVMREAMQAWRTIN